ncbi:hypothetical protein ACEZDB_37340 [Streptacidiphilus sp. N1-3]|uniref:Uncharacterized protein n=1 Tax=Streptacidiphilus alkalitolerans TaxID=3342712 RepID=A0ABV6XDG5_9ACTN
MGTYLDGGDPARQRTDYYPAWLDNLADDVTMEASVMDGVIRGAQAVRTVLGHARTLYDYQEFVYVGEHGPNGFAEDYLSRMAAGPIGSVVVVRLDEEGRTRGIVISHRPLRAVVTWSRLMGEHFAGTPYADYFLTPALARELLAETAG